MKEHNERILAIVVTYNRLEFLKRCVQALLSQTFKDFDILIINNGSTDGTKEWLDTLPDSIIRIHQDNFGGAGGFYTGQKYGMENNYDWVWMMDDDGVPDCRQLEYLKNTSTRYRLSVLNPLVCDINNHNILSLNGESKSKYQLNEVTKEVTCPFNGTFIHRRAIEKAGFIKKEMFIWGDEVEYRQRLRNFGFEMYTVTYAIHLHPPMKIVIKKVIPYYNKLVVKIKPKKFSKYYYRNLGFFNFNYCDKKILIVDALCYIVFFLSRFQIGELLKFVRYYYKGAINDYSE